MGLPLVSAALDNHGPAVSSSKKGGAYVVTTFLRAVLFSPLILCQQLLQAFLIVILG